MNSIIDVCQWALNNWSQVIVALNAVVVALIALFLIIPGNHPEDWLQGFANWLAKFSKK